MGRRANADSAKTFGTIVVAANRVLVEAGASKLTLRRVAAQAGLSIGTVHYYFRSKHQLIEMCLSNHSAEVRKRLDAVQAALDGGADIEDVLGIAVHQVFLRSSGDQEVLRLRMMSALESQEVSDEAPGPFLLAELKALAALLAAHACIGLTDARMLVHSVASLVARYGGYHPNDLRVILALDDDTDVSEMLAEHLQQVTRALIRHHRTNERKS